MKMLLSLICLLPAMTIAGSAKVYVGLSPAGDFTAKTSKVRGFVEKVNGSYVARELSFAVGSLDSEQDTRNEHMWKEMGGKDAKVTVKDAKGSGGKGTGIMVVKGITKSINFDYTEKSGVILAKFKIKLNTDYGIKPSFLGVTVEDEAKIEAEIPVR